MNVTDQVGVFLDGSPFAVVGASNRRHKYGNKCLRAYLQNDMKAYPVNPNTEDAEGLTTYANLEELPEVPHGVSIITPPPVTEIVIDSAIALGVKNIWIQPGAEHPAAIERAEAAGVNVLAWGPCLLVALHFRE